MSKNEDTGSPSWGASFFIQTNEDVARAAASARSPRPSVVFSSKDDQSDSQFSKLQRQLTRVLKSFAFPDAEVKNLNYNPEVLTSQKRQWANFQLQYLDHRTLKEPSRLFESMVVVGLHPNCDLQALQGQYIYRKSEGSGKLQGSLGGQNQSRVEPLIEPKVLFAYPPEKPLPLKYKDLLSFCFPGGVEVHAAERTPSMSELNELLLGQEHLKQSDLSFVFRLQVADDSTLYGCCVLVEEIVHRPSGLLSLILEKPPPSFFSRFVLTTRRCYCILSRLPFFELHFGVLNSIFTEERLQRLTKTISVLGFESLDECTNKEDVEEDVGCSSVDDRVTEDAVDIKKDTLQSSSRDFTPFSVSHNDNPEHQVVERLDHPKGSVNGANSFPVNYEADNISSSGVSVRANLVDCNNNVGNLKLNKQAGETHLPTSVVSLLRYYQHDISDSSYSFQNSLIEERNDRSDLHDNETSVSGQEDSDDLVEILDWAKANSHSLLQIICEYYGLRCPSRGSTLRFHPLEHLHALEYHRPDATVLHIAGSTIALQSCSTSLEFAEAHTALLAEEEAAALSTWAVACMCGSLRLEHVLTIFAGALLEKQIVVVCSNLGILSALVLSIVPLIRPYQWQSLLMPVLPDDMLDFLDAPVPYVVGVKNKTNEVQSKLTNVILVDSNKSQVKSSTVPQLPRHRELFSSLSPYHAKLVGESFLARKRPVYKCTDVQVEAAKGFLGVLRSYLDSLCSNLRSHTITNVQSNNDKVSLLLKESFIDSFPSRDRPFMKLFVDTQLFTVHTDLALSFYQKE